MEKNEEDKFDVKPDTQVVCPKHSIDFDQYCKDCSQMICKECVSDHKKDGHKCLSLGDYGRENLEKEFKDILEEIKKEPKDDQISPDEAKIVAMEMMKSLKSMRNMLEMNLRKVTKHILAIERLKVAESFLPNTNELIMTIDNTQKSLDVEVDSAAGFNKSLLIIQASKELLKELSENTSMMKKAKSCADKILNESGLEEIVKDVSTIKDTLKKISGNKLLNYTARVSTEMTSRFVYGILKQDNELYYYNVDTHLTDKVRLPSEIPVEPTLTQVMDRLYMTGGGDYLKSNLEFIHENSQITKKAEMSVGKKWHGAVVLNNKEFMTIGGYNHATNYLNECDKYNTETDTWETMPALNVRRQSMAACLFENKYVYVIGGYSGTRNNSIEKLVLNPLANKWEEVKMKDDNTLIPFSCGISAQISLNEILILRGNKTADTFIYNVKENSVKDGDKLKQPDSFLLQTMYPLDGSLVTMGYFGSPHIFNLRSQSWEETEIVVEMGES